MSLVLAASKSTALVDWAGLIKVIWLSALFGGGTILIVSLGITLLTHAQSTSGNRRLLDNLGAILCLVAVLGIVVFGITLMLTKS